MSIVVIGVSHRTGSLDLLGELAVPADALPKALVELGSLPNVAEAVLLSTCTRTEVYLLAERFHGAYDDVRNFMSTHSNLAPARFADAVEVEHDEAAVAHLFRVAAGLESVVPGEHEILGQIRAAADAARSAGTCGPVLDHLFRRAVEAGKRVRTDTDIGRSVTSMSQAAVVMASSTLGSLSGRRVAVVGAGEMGRGLASVVAEHRVGELVVLNRDAERAHELATASGGRGLHLSELGRVLRDVDLVVTSTGSPVPVIDRAMLLAAERGPQRPLLLVDIAVPRDVDPAARSVDGVDVLDIDDLGQFVRVGLDRRAREVPAAKRIVAEELDRYEIDRRSRAVAPLVSKLRSHADHLRRAEIERYESVLASLDEHQRAAVESLTRGVVNKLLHQPTVGLKAAAGSARGERLARSVHELFDL